MDHERAPMLQLDTRQLQPGCRGGMGALLQQQLAEMFPRSAAADAFPRQCGSCGGYERHAPGEVLKVSVLLDVVAI